MDSNKNNFYRNPFVTGGIFYFQKILIVWCLFGNIHLFSQATVKVQNPKINFGFVKRGQVIENIYKISNVGKEALVLNSAEVSCSCTLVEFPKKPIMPNETAEIKVRFNTETVYGRQDRVVQVNCNDPRGPFKLRYKGVVLKN